MLKKIKPGTKLQYRNDWESHVYFIDDPDNANRQFIVEELRSVEINGIEYRVNNAFVTETYNDMGHQYSAHSTQYFIIFPVLVVGTKRVSVNVYLNEIIRKKIPIKVVYGKYDAMEAS